MKRLLALILCFAMLLSLTACMETPADTSAPPETLPNTEPPTETSSNEELARDMYAQARMPLDNAADVTLELLITTLVEVGGDEFSEQSSQTLTYQAKGTEDAIIVMAEKIQYSVHSTDKDEEAEPASYTEIWHQGNVYAQYDEAYRYSGAVSADDAADRYTPVVLLDAALYGSVTYESAEEGTRILFAEPTAAEIWAIPQEGQLQEASGSAMLDAAGSLTEMQYTVTYTYGPSRITTTVQSKPLDTAKVVVAPEDPDAYTAISSVDALRMNLSAIAYLFQADSITHSDMESLTCEAAGVVRNQSAQANIHGRKKDTQLKSESSVYFMNYGIGESQEYELEETFLDGKLTSVVNDGLPSTDSTVSWEDVWQYMATLLTDRMPIMDHWEDATITDLGSVYFLEYRLNENFGNTMQNNICNMLWNDPAFLINLSSNYENTELNGYLSVDKYTGIPVAAGFYYKGVHTIEGQDYALILQYDQSIEAPSMGAYKEITDTLPPEEEPETKPTPLFYHVTGQDGQEMWLLGTIHVGDERTAYLPSEIYDAFTASDALALECNTELFDKQVEEDEDLASEVSALYFLSDGKQLESLMEEEDYQQAYRLLKAVGANNANMPYAKPYLWSNTIELFYLRQGYQLHADQGVEERLTDWAEQLDKEILEIESSMAQLKMLTGFSTDLQLWMLSDVMESDPRSYWEDTAELYELWCAGDEAAMREELSKQWDTAEMTQEEITKYQPLMEEYRKAMDTDRNAGMLDAAIEYLESGQVIFYAVGLAHLLDDTNGLVDTLQEAGYTVELVTYAS